MQEEQNNSRSTLLKAINEIVRQNRRSMTRGPAGVLVNPDFNPFLGDFSRTRPRAGEAALNLDFFAPPARTYFGLQQDLELPSKGWNDEASESSAERPRASGKALSVSGRFALVPMADKLVIVHLDRAQRRIDLVGSGARGQTAPN